MTKKLLPILLLTITMLVGAFIGMMYRASNTELIEVQDWSEVETIEPTKRPRQRLNTYRVKRQEF